MSVPILIACFIRPEQLKRCLEPLESLPNPIYVVIDSPRDEIDSIQVTQVKEILKAAMIEVVDTLSFNSNQGTNSVALGIDWVLQKYDSVIVIEEDILISRQFVTFAERMLLEYEDDFRVGSITAMNLVPTNKISRSIDLYRFSAYFYAWGWATWKTRWEQMIPTSEWDIDTLDTPLTARNPLTKQKWKNRFWEVKSGRAPGLWDYRWIYTYWRKEWLTIIPNRNLALNIGFDLSATHTRVAPEWAPKVVEVIDDLVTETLDVTQDIKADKWSSKHIHNSYWVTILKTVIKKKTRSWIP